MLDLKKLKALRTKVGLTQEQAARKSAIGGKQNWNAIESGRKANVSLETLDRIAKALGVKSQELLE